MTTIKSYTDLEQSKKLAEILPIETADMYWQSNLNSSDRQYLLDMGEEEYFDIEINFEHCSIGDYDIPAWSLAALLNVLPDYIDYDTIRRPDLMRTIDKNYMVIYSPLKHSGIYDNPVDACVDMIEKLHELNLL